MASPATAFTTTASIASCHGRLLKLSHRSSATQTPMALNLFLPPAASPSNPAPLLIFLSGLTCSPDNCAEKGFLQAHASPLNLAILYPDTSPRGTRLPGEHAAWDFGAAASFYLDAERPPWRAHYRMETYLARELPDLLFRHFAQLDGSRVSLAGHSVGGHGALTLFLRHPGRYRSVSAFAPVCNPCECPWGQKAFAGYLGDDRDRWRQHDATELVRRWDGPLNCLIDVGTEDQFYKAGQLLPENFARQVEAAGIDGVKIRYQEGYDHSYFFVSTFGRDHVLHAAKALGLV
ncbi:uncharacterized protein UV8b_03524 [Ustilaginoidea virens]|uniref:S-formylglutathione hydrolase n=1 Tax=Ustilaginoidea virens TaxID=1159556 RepID=A0A8E5HQ20_USTVR|nr:uncharacterized protein UV8b_03524 [Ustilaginoidea virens]QUC19283.1 hypothetical protein UV8b_03524 [Ustilaginoidea virens]